MSHLAFFFIYFIIRVLQILLCRFIHSNFTHTFKANLTFASQGIAECPVYKSVWGHMFSSCKSTGMFLAWGVVVVVIIECCTLVPPLGFPRIYEGCPLMWYSFEKHLVWSWQAAIINFQHKIRWYEDQSTPYFRCLFIYSFIYFQLEHYDKYLHNAHFCPKAKHKSFSCCFKQANVFSACIS